jgi:diguanylate cyclase (GGDEF)-like protein
VWGKDPEGEIRLLTANKASAGLNGSRLQDLVGLPLEEYYSNSMSFINLVQDTFTSGDIRKVELLFRSRFTREEKWVLCDFIRVSERNVLNILRDISQEKQRQQVDEDSRRQIELLRQAMTAFTAVLDLDQVNKNILEYLQKLIPHDNALLFLAEGGELHVRATSGFSREEDPLDQVIPTHNPQFEAINRNRMPLFLTDAQAYRPFETLGPLNCGRSWLGIPLVGHAQIMGYLSVYAKQPGMYGSEHTRLAEIFASEASIAIENANLFEQVQQLAVTDELTGFYNRRYFYELVELELARSRRYHHPVSLLMIDIDHFKAVNDQYGHATGDRVLKEICNSMRRMVRESDIPGRHGGEEFVILLPETPRDRAADVAERLRQAVAAEPLTVDEYEISVTLSIGVTEFADSKQDLDTFLRQADQAMYSAKQAGRNRVSIWHDTPEG